LLQAFYVMPKPGTPCFCSPAPRFSLPLWSCRRAKEFTR
jgi:hypothetical protein